VSPFSRGDVELALLRFLTALGIVADPRPGLGCGSGITALALRCLPEERHRVLLLVTRAREPWDEITEAYELSESGSPSVAVSMPEECENVARRPDRPALSPGSGSSRGPRRQ
jgi:hypothetical protein